MLPYDARSPAAARLASEGASQVTYLPTRPQSPPPQRRNSRPPTPPTPDLEYSAVKSLPMGKSGFLGVGLIVLLCLCALPIWDALAMLQSFEYAMWMDHRLPEVLIVASLGLIAFFFLITVIILGRWASNPQASLTLVTTTSMILTLFGIVMVVVSFPLARDALKMHNDITYNCMGIEKARAIHLEYMKLLALRTTPDCAKQYTIEACEGYQANSSLTKYIKAIEKTYLCSGFCYQPAEAALVQSSANTSGIAAHAPQVNLLRRARITGTKASALQQDQRLRTDEALPGEGVVESEASESFPPALYSIANYTKTCDGSVARSVVNFSGDIASQLWYTGIVIIFLSLCTGFKEWTSKLEQ
mmetsp:Transcript_52808/g.113075  ORF Transcript_52808/g.113075 Transcript_52808/m.113075 type:complete len:359 (-) Transcript_52808:58-1134(-)